MTYCLIGRCSTTVSRKHPADRALTCSGGTRTRAYCLIGRCSTSCKPEAPRCTELSLAQVGLEPVTYCLIGRCSTTVSRRLYRALTFSLLLSSHGGISSCQDKNHIQTKPFLKNIECDVGMMIDHDVPVEGV